MVYNETELKASETVFDLVLYANNAGNGILAGSFIISLFFILLFLFKNWDVDKNIIASSFIVFIVSIIMWYSELVSIAYPTAFAAFTGFTLLLKVTINR